MAETSRRDRNVRAVYLALAVVGLVATWVQNIRYFIVDEGNGITDFFPDGFANAAAASLTSDLIVVSLAAAVFMWVEGRRLGMRALWAYYLLGFGVAMAFAFPLFLSARQARLGSGD